MSKLYNKYQKLKQLDSSKVYLFKSGIFYLFLDKDAIRISEKLGLKLTALNEKVQKCGFPVAKLSKYTELLNHCNIEYQIVDENLNSINLQQDYIKQNDVISIIESIKKVDLNKLSPIQAFELIRNYHETLIKMED